MVCSDLDAFYIDLQGPVLSSKLTRHRELFWSTSSYQHHEVINAGQEYPHF